MSPQQISEQIKSLHLTQKEFAERIKVAPETVARWLSGDYIQSRAMNELMRLFFEREEAKCPVLHSGEATPQQGETIPLRKAEPRKMAVRLCVWI